MEHDYHGYQRELERTLERVKASEDINEQNKADIFKFYDWCIADGLKVSRQQKVVTELLILARMFDKPFREANKDDIIKVVTQIENGKHYKTKMPWKEQYKRDFKGLLKRFYRWLRNSEDYPDEVRWIKKTSKMSNGNKLPEDMLTEDDIRKLMDAAEHPRDKALVLVLYESGCRIGEILTLKIKNVQFDKYGAVLLVNGKTGQRRVRIISSTPLLSKWLEIHPFKQDPESYVWLMIGYNRKNKPLTYSAVLQMLKILAKRASVSHKVNPHNFRHSRATELAAMGLNESQLKAHFGWRKSDMPGVYVHLAGRDVDNALLKVNGLAPEEKVEEKLKIQICQRCKEKNSPMQQFCGRCGSPLNLKIALESETKREEADNITNVVIRSIMEEIKQKYNIDVERMAYEKIKELKMENKLKEL